MKVNTVNNISFQKKLVARACVIKNDAPQNVEIYLLDANEDGDYFQKAWACGTINKVCELVTKSHIPMLYTDIRDTFLFVTLSFADLFIKEYVFLCLREFTLCHPI